MNYTEVLNRRIKKAGMDFARGRSDAGTRREGTGARPFGDHGRGGPDRDVPALDGSPFLYWKRIRRSRRTSVRALGAESRRGRRGMEMAALRSTLTELQEGAAGSMDRLPPWILVDGGYAALSPVVYGWLEGRAPDLPEGMRLYFPSVGTVYGNEIGDGRRRGVSGASGIGGGRAGLSASAQSREAADSI